MLLYNLVNHIDICQLHPALTCFSAWNSILPLLRKLLLILQDPGKLHSCLFKHASHCIIIICSYFCLLQQTMWPMETGTKSGLSISPQGPAQQDSRNVGYIDPIHLLISIYSNFLIPRTLVGTAHMGCTKLSCGGFARSVSKAINIWTRRFVIAIL